MGGLSLADALELVILIAAQQPDRLDRAVRRHGRLEVELPALTLAEARFALAALGGRRLTRRRATCCGSCFGRRAR